MTDKKDPEEMSESELKEELKKVYKEMNDVSESRMDDIDFQGKMIMKKKDEDGEVVETRETDI